MKARALTLISASMVAFATALTVHAADPYPSKPIRLVSQFPAGGGTDVLARLVAPKMAEILRQPVIVENRAGAAGNIGADYVAKSPADGYTLLVANNVIVTNPAGQKTPFDVVKDFAPITLAGSTPIVLAVHPSVPAKTTRELIALVKQSPGKYAFSSCGTGTAQHLAGELLKEREKLDLPHAPYKGCGPAVIDGISGQVPILFNTINNVQPHVLAGKLRILAVASKKKSSLDPTIDTIADSAGISDFDADIWYGFLAPSGTPQPILARLHDVITTIVMSRDTQEKLRSLSFNASTSSQEEFAGVIKSDLAKWSKLVKDARIDVSN